MMTGADIRAGRLAAPEIAEAFADLHPLLAGTRRFVEADRCYFCYDAPCVPPARPASTSRSSSARSRPPTRAAPPRRSSSEHHGRHLRPGLPDETLCEEACVRNLAEDKPVKIGELQRYATDELMDGRQPSPRRPPAGAASPWSAPDRRGSPARIGSRCTATTSSSSTRATSPAGSTNTASPAYKTVDDFAQREVDFILPIGGIDHRERRGARTRLLLADLKQDFDAVFLGMGLAA